MPKRLAKGNILNQMSTKIKTIIYFSTKILIKSNTYPVMTQVIYFSGANFEPEMLDKAYRVIMKLNIRAIHPSDFGVYMCVAKNALGVTDGSIKVYSM